MGTSLVSWDGGEFTSSCGYCRGNGFTSSGITAFCMTAHDYQNLVDRGWRRCGEYLYKPNNRKTCCPMYTIRCDAVNLQLSKSQKKVLRRFNTFLMGNESNPTSSSPQKRISTDEDRNLPQSGSAGGGINEVVLPRTTPQPISEAEKEYMETISASPAVDSKSQEPKMSDPSDNNYKESPSSSKDDLNKKEAEDSKPKCKKAKLMRLERRKAKLEKKGISVETVETKLVNKEKTLEDYVQAVTPENSTRKLEIMEPRDLGRVGLINYSNRQDTTYSSSQLARKLAIENDPFHWPESRISLVRSVSNKQTHLECFRLYQKYQKIIHNDDCDSFYRYKTFLMDSPLNVMQRETDSESPPCGYGTFHQLYRIDGKLIAVGVLDILPRCVSSVYFFYDPDYMHLSLGTYGALRELEFTRKLSEKCPSLNQYYLGYYIHSCQKMRYKGQWKPSYLLCPEAYSWHPISECLSKLEGSPYSRLNEDVNAKSEEDDVDVGAVKLFLNHLQTPTCVRDCSAIGDDWKRIAGEFARLVGRSAAEKILLRYHPTLPFAQASDSDDSD